MPIFYMRNTNTNLSNIMLLQNQNAYSWKNKCYSIMLLNTMKVGFSSYLFSQKFKKCKIIIVWNISVSTFTIPLQRCGSGYAWNLQMNYYFVCVCVKDSHFLGCLLKLNKLKYFFLFYEMIQYYYKRETYIIMEVDKSAISQHILMKRPSILYYVWKFHYFSLH